MDFTEILDSAQDRCVLVVGDAMLDHYIWGDALRISPEAPVPVVTMRKRSSGPGGAANTAAGIVALGGEAGLVAIVGADVDGADLAEHLRSAGVGCHLVTTDDRPTTAKTRVIAGSHQVARIDTEDQAPLSVTTERALLSAIESAAADGGIDAVLISDYSKGAVSAQVAQSAIGLAKRHDLPAIIDPKGASFEKYRGATMVTPNEIEARTAAGAAVDSDLDTVADRLGSVLPETSLLITRGDKGMALYEPGSARWDLPAISHRVHDVTGAGDTVAAALAVSLAAGAETQAAVRLANAAAARAVQRVGVARISTDDLRLSADEA